MDSTVENSMDCNFYLIKHIFNGIFTFFFFFTDWKRESRWAEGSATEHS